MELNLPPLTPTCFVTGERFVESDRVVSHLVRNESSGEVVRYDVAEAAQADFTAPGRVACRWVQVFKVRAQGYNAEREMKLTAENIFLTLADPATELSTEDARLVQFLALMLERKRLLRPKGLTANGTKRVYEHAKNKQFYEVPVGDLNPEFFIAVQEQLSVLVGGGGAPGAE
jgi:hypothetical protein